MRSDKIPNLWIVLVAFAVLITSIPAEAGRLKGNRSLSTTAHGYAIVGAPTRAGRKSQRFEVRAGDCGADSFWSDCANDRERSEIAVSKRWHYGQDMWIGFSVYLPDDFRTSSRVATTVGQIHQSGGPSGTANGLPSFPPVVQLEMTGNAYTATVHLLTGSRNNVRNDVRKFSLAKISDMRGRWTDIQIHLNTKEGADLLEVFIDGRSMARITDFINFKPKEYYLKYGIYRSFISKHGGPMPTQILFIDEVRMGKSHGRVVVNEKRPVD